MHASAAAWIEDLRWVTFDAGMKAHTTTSAGTLDPPPNTRACPMAGVRPAGPAMKGADAWAPSP
jgi:hypothetical protein